MDKQKMNDVERDLLEGLGEFVEDLKSDTPLRSKYTCRRIVLDLEPQSYSKSQVKATRKLLNISQALFAQFLGVSLGTVRKWEQGTAPPRDMACRFMDEIQLNPTYWKQRLANVVQIRKSKPEAIG